MNGSLRAGVWIHLRAPMLLLAACNLGGCFLSSTYVSSIGARETHGQGELTGSGKEISIEMKERPASVVVGHSGVAFPYLSLDYAKERESTRVGKAAFDPNQVRWLDTKYGRKVGQVDLVLDGTPMRFEVREVALAGGKTDSPGYAVSLDRRYRRWYGYPAQGLLVVSMPVDIVVNVVLAGVVILALPFYAIYLGVQAATTSPASK